MKACRVSSAAVLFAAMCALAFPAPLRAQGGAPAMLAMLSGEVDFVFAEALLAAPQVKAGNESAAGNPTSA